MYTFSQLVVLGKPAAEAVLRGAELAPEVRGTVRFYNAGAGTMVVAEVFGLPSSIHKGSDILPAGPFHGMHVHSGESCGPGTGDDPFALSGGHFDLGNHPHPLHTGDLPPLLSNDGYAYLACYTDRFTPAQVVGRTLIVHQSPDDFRTQPAGNSGLKIACGHIAAMN